MYAQLLSESKESIYIYKNLGDQNNQNDQNDWNYWLL